ncbi:hypothetical protein EX87_14355 [Brevibacillus laterosporus]|uniref:Uncharacterized protein n=1 Tax=Brevibacillus laterosporus TaxID=1465 RepID=A0A0F7EIC1_BRELA|nr:hypothetical protein EX87_14355 [Brevibacillus laterosporus]
MRGKVFSAVWKITKTTSISSLTKILYFANLIKLRSTSENGTHMGNSYEKLKKRTNRCLLPKLISKERLFIPR